MKHVRLAALGITAFVALFFIFGAYFTVHERENAVVTRNGAFSYVAGPGFHFKTPFIESVETFDLSIRSLNLSKQETFTVDNQHVDVDLVVQYSVPAPNVERVFRETRDYEQRLASMAVDRMKQALGRRNINELPEQRGLIAKEVFDLIRGEAARLYGLSVSDVQIGNINYSEAFRRAVDAAAVAKAQVEQAHQQQRQAEVQAASAKIKAAGEADAAIESARGSAQSRLLTAQAEAESIRLRGEAEAKAIAAQAQALGQSPNLVALEQARRWDGKLPQNFVPGSAVPFLNLQQH